ncbi:MAG: hypothetical protein ACHP84_04850 [Caulobacterales bacterium]
MCFIGVGDHGGGPTERQIAWCRDHADAFDGCRLVFSSPSRFFDAVEAEGADLPLVTGELQHHAVGCYSVMRAVKLGVRRAEEALDQARIVAEADPAPDQGLEQRLTAAWRNVCFNQFHDTLGGTCIASAYAQAEDQLGAAKACADEIVQFGLRRMLVDLPDDARQRIAVFNASERPFDGYAVLAPWTEARWRRHWRLLAEDGSVVRHQPVGQEAATGFPRRVLLRLTVPPGRLRLLRLDRGDPDTPDTASRSGGAPTAPALSERLQFGDVGVSFGEAASVGLPGGIAVAPRLEVRDDPTDTWSHGVARLGGALAAAPAWGPARLIDDGPLMRSALRAGTIGASDLAAEWRVYRGEPLVELLLRVHWRAARQVLKLVLPMGLKGRVDGVMGGTLARDLDGRERPLRDFTLLHREDGCAVGVVCPEVFALDAAPDGVRLTLLRSPLMAHHDPARAEDFPRAPHADQGVHEFRFLFAAFEGLTPDWLEQRAAMLHRPPIAADWTKGMTARGDW